MLAAFMNKSSIATSGPEQESVRLYVGELAQLSDELAHRSSRLREDGRRVLDAILTGLETHITAGPSASRAEADLDELAAVRRELLSSWLRADSIIDELLSSAADELSSFANSAESRIFAYERAIHHRKIGASAEAWSNKGEP